MRLSRRGVALLIAGVTCVTVATALLLVVRPSVVARSALATARSQVEQEYAAALNPGDSFPLESLPSATDGAAIRLRDRQTCCIVIAPGCATCSEYAGVAEELGVAYPDIQCVLLMVGTDGQGVTARPHMKLAVDQNRAAVAKLSDHDARAPAVFLIRADGTVAWKSVGIKLQLVWDELNGALGQFGRSSAGTIPGGEVTPKVGEKFTLALCAGTPVSTDRDTVFLLHYAFLEEAEMVKPCVNLFARLRPVADTILVVSVYDEAHWRAACEYTARYSTTSIRTSTQNLRLLPSINQKEVTKLEEYVQQNKLGVTIVIDPRSSFALTSAGMTLFIVAPNGVVKAIVPWDIQGFTEEAALVRYVRSIIEH